MSPLFVRLSGMAPTRTEGIIANGLRLSRTQDDPAIVGSMLDFARHSGGMTASFDSSAAPPPRKGAPGRAGS
jgi:hypothetical protein